MIRGITCVQQRMPLGKDLVVRRLSMSLEVCISFDNLPPVYELGELTILFLLVYLQQVSNPFSFKQHIPTKPVITEHPLYHTNILSWIFLC
jgi:hypothetical protein